MFKAEYVFARILLPFTAGIIIFYFVNSGQYINTLAYAALISFILLISSNLFYNRFNIYRFKGLAGLNIFIFFFILGGLLCLLNKEKLNPDYFGRNVYRYLKISVCDEPQQSNNIMRFRALVLSGYKDNKQIKLSGQLLVGLKLDSLNPITLNYGDEIIIATQYTEIEPPYNPAEFNFKAWLQGQNIYHQAFISQDHLYKTNQNNGNPIIKFAFSLREKQIAKYRKLIKNDEAFAVASTLILGYRSDLSKETLSAYSKTGTIHALSVSGAHVAIIYIILDTLLMVLNKRTALKTLKLIIICILIWAYALITGLSPSVVRSAIMITLFIIAKTYSKNRNGYNILSFSAFCQLLYNPFLIWDVGFQLSYLAVFGLIYLQPKIYNSIYFKNKWINKLWNIIALSLAAQLVTFPLSIYYFHQFPVYFLFGNLFIMLPLSLMMYLGIAILIPYLDFLAPILEWIINKTNDVLKWISDLPLSTFSSVWITLPQLIMLSLAIGLFIYALDKKSKSHLLSAVFVFLIYQTSTAYDHYQAGHQKTIIFFSLKKAYVAAFLQGNNAILMTDLNASDKNYLFFVKPCLDQAQIKNIIFMGIKQDTIMPGFIKKERQIAFHEFKLLIIDESLNYKKTRDKAYFSAIWLHNDTKFDLNKLTDKIHFKSVIIDGNNKDYKIKLFKTFAKKNNIESYVLKKNMAYLINLTK